MPEWVNVFATIVIPSAAAGVSIAALFFAFRKHRHSKKDREDDLRHEYMTNMCRFLLQRVETLEKNYERTDKFCTDTSRYLDRVHKALVEWEKESVEKPK